MENFELVIIGGGIVGCSLFSLATLSGIKTALLEKCDDVSSYATKANSGIIHSGYDPLPNTLMAKYNVLGNQMFEGICKRLGEKFLKCGTLTVGREQDREKLLNLLERGKQNGVSGLRIIEKEELFEMEPNLNDEISLALFAPTGAVVSPFSICVAMAEEGIINGGKVFTKFEVNGVEKQENGFVVKANEKQVFGKFVVNCAGPNASDINALFKAKTFDMRFVKGEYILLDKTSKGFVNHPIFPLPTKKGKGILANISIFGNVMFGPTANPCEKEDTRPNLSGTLEIQQSVVQTVKDPNFKKTIKIFAGVRVKTGDDFVVERDQKNKNYYYAVGICSPGLTAAPAIAQQFLTWLEEDGISKTPIIPKKRKPYVTVRDLSPNEQKQLFKQNPTYAKVVCRCEEISEGEILDALHSPLPPTSIAAIKRRVFPTMGRCQGRVCIPKIIKIWAEDTRRLRSQQKNFKARQTYGRTCET